MKKLFEVVDDPGPDGTYVLVNPVTGKIYSFQPADTPSSFERTPSTIVVGVAVPPEVFRKELEKGIFFKEGAFYRSWDPSLNPRFLAARAQEVVEFVAPEPVDEMVDVSLHDQTSLVWHQTIPMRAGRLSFSLPNLQPGLYTLRCESASFGRLTTLLSLLPAAPKPQEEEEEELEKLEKTFELYQTLKNPADVESLAETVGESVLEAVEELNKKLKLVKKDLSRNFPSEQKKEALERMKEALKKLFGR